MINPLETTATARDVGRTHRDPACYEIADKLNELIGAVNGQEHSIQTLNSILKSVEYRIKDPGFRPLHIEDGQVQEDTPAFRVFEDGVRWTNAPPVPETEPQEQEDLQMPIQAAIFHFECAVRELEITSKAKFPARHSELLNARKRWIAEILAAAHREYAQLQPRTFQDGEYVTLGVDSPTVTSSTTNVRVEKRGDKYYWPGTNRELSVSNTAAQPGKGV